MEHFLPSAKRALELRHAMDEALWSSVCQVLDRRFSRSGAARMASIADGQLAHPLDYGAYFDLVLVPAGTENFPEIVKNEAADRLRRRLSEMEAASCDPPMTPAAGPLVSSLSPEHYSSWEIECFRRWWDIEPDNSMGLSGVSDTAFEIAQGLLDTALYHLRRAAPEMHGELLALIRDIVLAQPDGTQRIDYGGATSFSLWGAFTINAASHRSWPNYYGTIVHETAHNLLFALARNEPLIENSPDDRYNSPLRDDLRPMDGIFHAGFVSARESLAFDKLLCVHEDTGCLTDDEAAAVSGLLEGSVLTFWGCHRELQRAAKLTQLGTVILGECEAFMRTNFLVEAV